jgi:7-cyano-7-deazaguanine synthase
LGVWLIFIEAEGMRNKIRGENVDCLVVFSGGQDSTTSLYWAKEKFEGVHAATFDYGQRHRMEIESAKRIARLAGVESHEVIDVTDIMKTTSPLVDFSREVGQYRSVDELPGGIEPTFIPCRNILFLTIAANRAVVKNIKDLVIGVSAIDYGGYPDCRPEFVLSMEETLRHGLEMEIRIHTPVISLSKKDTVLLASKMAGCMEALAYSHTCYGGKFPPCGQCHACLLRMKGFREAGIEDPLIERAARSINTN